MRFSLKTFLLLLVPIGGLCGYLGARIQAHRLEVSAATQLQSDGFGVEFEKIRFENEFVRSVSSWIYGDIDQHVTLVFFPEQPTPQQFESLNHFPCLRELIIWNSDAFTGVEFQHVASPRIEKLAIKETQLTADGLQQIGQLKSLRQLTIVDDLARGYSQLCNLPRLSILSITAPVHDDEFCKLTDISTLRRLVISSEELSDEAIQCAANSSNLHLETLELFSPRLTDRSVELIADLEGLTELVISSDQVTPSSLPHLTRLKKLRHIRVFSSKVGDEDHANLAAIHPNLQMDSGD